MINTDSFSRRSMLQAALSAVVSGVPTADHGRIKPPFPVPDIAVVSQNQVSTTLPQLLTGHATALQLMFTQCETTCPMQGAIFERVQNSIPDMKGRKLQLLSLSIEPDNDKPAELRRWLQRFHAGSAWIAATAVSTDLARTKKFFGQGRSNLDDHSTQVQIVNHNGALIWRTGELPSAEEINNILLKLSQGSA